MSLVFHEQEDALEGAISSLEADLESKSLPALPFHTSPLVNGHGAYEAFKKNHLSHFRNKQMLQVTGADPVITFTEIAISSSHFRR